jgi:hypothetical protein
MEGNDNDEESSSTSSGGVSIDEPVPVNFFGQTEIVERFCHQMLQSKPSRDELDEIEPFLYLIDEHDYTFLQGQEESSIISQVLSAVNENSTSIETLDVSFY